MYVHARLCTVHSSMLMIGRTANPGHCCFELVGSHQPRIVITRMASIRFVCPRYMYVQIHVYTSSASKTVVVSCAVAKCSSNSRAACSGVACCPVNCWEETQYTNVGCPLRGRHSYIPMQHVHVLLLLGRRML